MSNSDKNTRESKGDKLFKEQGRGIYKHNDDQWSTGKHNNYASNKISVNRKQLLDRVTAQELNTYLNFGIFPTFADTYPDDVVGEYKYNETTKTNELVRTKYDVPKGYGPGTPGVRSLFNRAGAIVIGSKNGSYAVDPRSGNQAHIWRIANNVPLMDSPKARERIEDQLSCTISDLVYASSSGKMGQETYSYSDFMYCKHLGRVSNNYLITLRRFPSPVDDFIGFVGDYTQEPDPDFSYSSKNPACIGCMVTWLGVSGNELNNILKYNYRMPFKEQQSQMEDSKTDADSNTTLLGGLFSGFDESYRNQYLAGRGGEAFNHSMYKMFNIDLGNPPYTDHRNFKDRNKVYGPIDAIKSTYIRSDEGLIFNHKMTLVFEYELRSYNGINPRQAMLDLISNILNVTYITGSFWGGGIKSYGAAQSNIFTNLNVFKCRGGFTDFADAMAKDLSTIGEQFASKLGFGNGRDGFTLAGAWNALKGALNTLGGMLMGGMLNKLGRPQKAMYNSLLSPAPIGFWHVTIGNPKAPIMSIGNMIITNVQIEHNGPLGLDNFPTGLKVTVELDRGKPRDLRDIEKLYMHGNDRIYAPMTDKVFNMYKNSEQYKSSIRYKSIYNPVFKTTTKDKNNKDITVYDSLYEYTPKTEKVGETGKETVVQDARIVKDKDAGKEMTSYYTKYEPKINTNFEAKMNNVNFKKYFGTTDTYSIFFASTEQEYGAAKEKYDRTIETTNTATTANTGTTSS